ncbi:cytochrome c oxidase, cbb3-type, CcoQ subunit [Helicobacter ailurogastricus]|uniref:Cytochrome c oxidase subunit CcoQ n=1 Tax=Helicobacter ailurogastricus TaxID=1578720 RepID=A0A0K2XE92_9HELI|nr:cytochrome c oxidase, cbb3-type, CcoQ subunit [Helicobacter ailurogastricus]CRF40671.1 Cytochrome c oxidase subunit CcoQ [Helicobacter ailurogastricus]CRF43064.1 Cytochrome c oxidase subunit CcoQ [Helicobacter ailurogastricus]CRF44293.1 Cytochrome c oxidase subunit CcoQ [Helicobacter ailurogastricus]CRF52237.1 Cytochrome c oxidase subunit CcoQ [Helicobacter ailurogastricus]BDQ29358.1 cytochrome c oxidase, cbb3-type, CcoQ subunit [Helicobacter ailurogastricus]
MDIDTLRGFAYAFFTVLFTLFLYFYIISMYVKDKKGITDYERYSQLALQDELNDAPIEPRHLSHKKG